MARSNGTAWVSYTLPGMKTEDARTVISILQDQLNALNDPALTLKHVHRNPGHVDRPVRSAEQHQRFVRAHPESADGTLRTVGARTELSAAHAAE